MSSLRFCGKSAHNACANDKPLQSCPTASPLSVYPSSLTSPVTFPQFTCHDTTLVSAVEECSFSL